MAMLTYLLLFFVPFERIPSVELFGLTVRISTFILLAGVIAVLPLIWKKEIAPWSNIDKAIGLYYFIVFISILAATGKKRAFVVAAILGLMLFGYLLITRTLRQKFDFEKISSVVIWSGLVTSAYGFFQFFGDGIWGISPQITGLLPRYTKIILGFPRLQSTGVEPLYYANFLLLPVFILMARILNPSGNKKVFEYSSFVIIMTAFILTLSRGAYIGFFFALFVLICLVVLFPILRRKVPILLALGLIAYALSQGSVAAISGGQGVSDFSDQALDPQKTMSASTNPRLTSYYEAIRLFKTKPILGVGIGNFGVVNKLPADILPEGYAIVNNQYLETLAETGVLGFLTLFGLGVVLIIKLKKSLVGTKASAAAVALASAFAGMVMQYNFFSTIYILYFWVLVALIASLPEKQNG